MDFITECTDFTTNEGCLAAVKHHGCALQFVPEPMKTPEIILAAIQQHGYALGYLPYDKRTPELCLTAVKNHGLSLSYVPEHLTTNEIILAAIQNRGYALAIVPDHVKTYETCLLAVTNCGLAIQFVPGHLRSDELIDAALLESPYLLDVPYLAEYLIKMPIKIHHEPKQMPDKAYDTLEMGYDEDSAIKDGELMVDFHKEFDYGRYYRKATFEKFVLPSKLNPTTREAITEYTIYQAKV
jgi:hypothetical protein